jgi:hypothetical protein
MNTYHITEQQAGAIAKITARHGEPISIQGLLGEPDVIMVQLEHMWLGIETDGYTHS